MTPYGNRDLGQHWLRQWLDAWRHQAITWTNADFSSFKSSDIHIRAISQEMPQSSITKILLKITYLKFYWNSPGANELTSPKWLEAHQLDSVGSCWHSIQATHASSMFSWTFTLPCLSWSCGCCWQLEPYQFMQIHCKDGSSARCSQDLSLRLQRLYSSFQMMQNMMQVALNICTNWLSELIWARSHSVEKGILPGCLLRNMCSIPS